MIWKYVRHLEISGCNDNSITSMSFTSYPLMKTIQIKEKSFGKVATLIVSNLPNLVSINIGRNSFTQSIDWYGLNTNRNAIIRNCTQLKELVIGNYAFSDYYSLELSSLNSLERLVFGEYSFYHSPKFELEGK